MVLESFSLPHGLASRPASADVERVGMVALHPPSPEAPELPVVLLEDTGALVGLVLALGGVTLTLVTDEPDVRRHRHAVHRHPARASSRSRSRSR